MGNLKSTGIVLYLAIQLLAIGVISINRISLENGVFSTGTTGTAVSACLTITTVIMLLATIFGIANIRNVYRMIEKEAQYKFQEINLKNIADINRDLCIQKHDFLNHIHIVYGLILIDRYNEAKEYIENTFDGIAGTRRVIKTGNVVLTALLESKNRIASLKGIDMHIDVHGSFAEMPVKPWEITGILGNLIDNAIDAVSNLTQGKGHIHISITNSSDEYIFRINNNGPLIGAETISRIFSAGYTTKTQQGRGMGLFIVKSISDNYKGSVMVESNPARGTTFEVLLPKAQNDERGENTI